MFLRMGIRAIFQNPKSDKPHRFIEHTRPTVGRIQPGRVALSLQGNVKGMLHQLAPQSGEPVLLRNPHDIYVHPTV